MDDIDIAIFDLDGTLVDAYPAIYQSVNYTLAELGFPQQTDLDIRRAVGWGEHELWAKFIDEESLIEKAKTVYRPHHVVALKESAVLLPCAQELLAFLKDNGCKLALATNRPAATTDVILETLAIKNLFDVILCADVLGKFKPDPAILDEVIGQTGIAKSRALYVGDMAIDVETGNNAQIRTIAVVTGSSTLEEIEAAGPYMVVTHLQEIFDHLKGTKS